MSSEDTYIPSRSTIKAFCDIVKAFSMAAHVQQFILDVPAALAVQSEDHMLKALPLRLLMIRVIFAIGIIGAVD